MAFYYSASNRAFYSSDIVSVDAMPADKVAVTDEAYKALMAAQNEGKVIRPGTGGAPEAVEQGGAAATGITHELTAATAQKLGHVKIGAGVNVGADGAISVDMSDKRDHTIQVANVDLNTLLDDKTWSCSGTLKNTPIPCTFCIVQAYDTGAPVSGNIVQVCYVLQANNTVRTFWRNCINGSTFGSWTESSAVKTVNEIIPDEAGNIEIPTATTSQFGLVRLAAEEDVLKESPQTAVCTQLIYEINEFRRKSTAYAVGEKVDCAFQYERFLECTKAGTTSADMLDTRNVTHGQVIKDGTVEWTVRTHVRSVGGAVADENGNASPPYLPLSGGTMSGAIEVIGHPDESDSASLWTSNQEHELLLTAGAPSFIGSGSRLALYGRKHPKNPGAFILTAESSDDASKGLVGQADGEFTWCGQNIELVDSIGENFIRFKSGLQICWGIAIIPANSLTMDVTLPVPFMSTNYAVNSTYNDSGDTTLSGNLRTWVTLRSGSAFMIGGCSRENEYQWDRWIQFIAIGRWK